MTHNLIASPAFIVLKADNEFQHKMSLVAPLVRATMANAINQLW
ncbi:hypothetical protein [Sulfitobacter albidus]|nr:hypothetical protein [Sulfitobacter albidus]